MFLLDSEICEGSDCVEFFFVVLGLKRDFGIKQILYGIGRFKLKGK